MIDNMKNYCELCQCHIKESTIFADLSDEQLFAIKGVIKTVPFRRKSFIFHEGDPCKGLYVVKKGRVKLLRVSKEGKEQIINIVDSGGILGIEIFYNAKGYSTTALSMEDGEVCFISKEDFEKVLDSYPPIGRKIITALSKELDYAYERIGILGLMTARKRLAHLIYTTARDLNSRDEDTVHLRLSFSRLEIAELLGITQETSIRLLRGLKDEGLIDIKGKELIIPSLSRLKSLAEA